MANSRFFLYKIILFFFDNMKRKRALNIVISKFVGLLLNMLQDNLASITESLEPINR